MSTYETHIGKVDNSTFAIGENATAWGGVDRRDRDDLAKALSTLLDIVTRYTDPAAIEVVELARAATREISAEKPDKEPFRRLTEAARRLISKLGSSLIEAGTLANAVGKISDLIHHL